VTLVFVLNVVPDPWQRLCTLRSATQHLRPGGYVLVATRSVETIKREVQAKAWLAFNDGYLSHAGKRTFQKGIDAPELALLATKAGLTLQSCSLNLGTDTSYLLARREL